MFKYVNFQILTFIKQRSNQYFAIASILATLIINSIIASVTTDFISTPNIQDNILSFALSSVFTLLIIVHIYLQGREDGTELLFATKSLSRIELYFAKALSSIFLITIFSTAFLLINWVPAIVSSGNPIERISYVFSQLFGGIIIQTILLFVFSFIAIISNKMKTIITMLLSIVFFPIFTIIAAPITSGQPSQMTSINSVTYIYGDELLKDTGYIDTYTTSIDREFENYYSNESYSSIANIDIWSQFNNMMNIFNTNGDKYNSDIIQKWEKKTIKTLSDQSLAIPAHVSTNVHIGAELIYPTLSENQFKEMDFSFNGVIDSVDEWFTSFGHIIPDDVNQTQTWLELFENSNVIQRMKFIQYFIDGVDRTSDIQRSAIYETAFESGATRATSIQYLNNIYARTSLAYMDFLEANSTFTSLEDPISISNYLTNNQAMIGEFIIGNESMDIYVSSDYVNVWASLLLLILLSLSLFITGGVVYNWKDFK